MYYIYIYSPHPSETNLKNSKIEDWVTGDNLYSMGSKIFPATNARSHRLCILSFIYSFLMSHLCHHPSGDTSIIKFSPVQREE